MIVLPRELHVPAKRQYGYTPKDPILFSVKGRRGVSLQEALRRKLDGLDHASEAVFNNCGTKISYLIEVCGHSICHSVLYTHVMLCTLQIPGYRSLRVQKYAHARKNGCDIPFARLKVVQQLAEVMSKFLDEVNQDSLQRLTAVIDASSAEGEGDLYRSTAFRQRLY